MSPTLPPPGPTSVSRGFSTPSPGSDTPAPHGGGTRGGGISIVATVRERWLWPDEAAMFGPLAVRGGAGRVGGMRVGPRLRSVENPWETSVRAGGEAVWETLRGQQYP